MIYYRKDGLIIRDLLESDARTLTDANTAQGRHADVSKFLTRLKDPAEGGRVSLIAEYRGQPAGYIHVCQQSAAGPSANLPVIVDFGVLEQYRRIGIGSRLMDAAELIAFRHADEIALAIGPRDGREGARRMYARRGYCPDGSNVRHRGMFPAACAENLSSDGDPVLYMSKRLCPEALMEDLISRFVSLSGDVFRESLVGVYLHGSAAMGCWHPRTSDLDFLVVVSEPMSCPAGRDCLDRLLELDSLCPGKGIEMSVITKDVCAPFVYPTPFILHYSRRHRDWARKDPEDYVRRMNGTDPDLAAHVTVLLARGRCLYGTPVHSVFDAVPEAAYLDSIYGDVCNAEEEIEGQPVYLILNLTRVLAYLREKAVLSKREGGEWGLGHLPEEYAALIRAALREYAGMPPEGSFDVNTAKAFARYMLDAIASEKENRTAPEARCRED